MTAARGVPLSGPGPSRGNANGPRPTGGRGPGSAGGGAAYSPSLPIASTGQESIASWHWASSSGVSGCLETKEKPFSSCRVKLDGAVTRQTSQSMHWVST